MLKNFVLDLKNKETNEVTVKRVLATNIIGHVASYTEDYTEAIEAYVAKNMAGAELLYWGIEEFYGKTESITIELDENEAGTVKIFSRDLNKVMEIEQYEIVEEISEELAEQFPLYEVINMLDKINFDRDLIGLNIVRKFKAYIALNNEDIYSIVKFEADL